MRVGSGLGHEAPAPESDSKQRGDSMAKSSIHIGAGNFNFFRHNDRSRQTKNSIFFDEPNEYWNDSETAYRLWKSEVEKRSEKYRERTGRKLHKKTVTHLSAIVNLNRYHTLGDLRPLADYLENEFGAKVVQMAIHRDEGHRDDEGRAVKNYHAHIEMVGIDEEGNSIRRKLGRAALSRLQDKTAELLRMERGTNYAKERKPRPKRLDTYDFKAAKELEEAQRKAAKREIARVKDLQAENKKLREELRQARAKRADYARLESEVRRLKDQAKARELTIEQLQTKMTQLRADLLGSQAENDHQEMVIQDQVEQIEELKAENAGLKTAIEAEKATNRTLSLALQEKTAQIGSQEREIEELKQEVSRWKGIGERLAKLVDRLTEHFMPKVYQSLRRLPGIDARLKKIEEELEQKEKIHFPPMPGYYDDNPGPGFGGQTP